MIMQPFRSWRRRQEVGKDKLEDLKARVKTKEESLSCIGCSCRTLCRWSIED